MIKYNYKLRDFIKLLHANGYYETKSGKGSHQIFSNGYIRISVPCSNKEIKGVLAYGLIKKYNLK